MFTEKDFDKIRPYNDTEVTTAIDRIIHDGTFTQFVKDFFKTKNLPTYIEQLRKVKSIDNFQQTIKPLVAKLVNKTVKKLIIKGSQKLDKDKKYLFISNHRDIILDSTFLNYLLVQECGIKTTEIAIGSNLLIKPWIVDLVKLNKSFVVNRSLSSPRQTFESAQLLSHYIRDTITRHNNSIWLAQREGRTKDGNDATQLSLLKMLNISGTKTVIENFKELNIIPVSISYEFEPCDVYKVHELYLKESEKGYTKTPEDDLKSMLMGIITDKGRIAFIFGKPINEYMKRIFENTDKVKGIGKILQLLDYQILRNFRLWPNNYIAHDILNDSHMHTKKYTQHEKDVFLSYMQQQLSKIEGKNEKLKRRLLLRIYANPVDNKNRAC